MERCGAKKASILAAGRRGIRSENTNRVKWVVRREVACGADWRRINKKNFTRVRVKFKTGGENIWHNTRRCDELWVLADGLKWGWRKSVYLAKNFGSKIVVGVI